MAMDLFMRVTLINALKRILDQYPNNGQILKEILQNAEDAGASHVKFLLDETHYGDTMGVSTDDPAYRYLGPALYVYNDAHLTDDDWKGISDIEGSIKADDPTTIGRFGLGFKSVFHITDVPSIYSGDNIGFLDPHEQLLRKDGYRVPVYGCCLQDPTPDCPGRRLFHDAPYQHDIFNSRSLKKYQHTIFRFPLRAQRHSSKLSTDGCSVEDIWQLLETLSQESYMNLLFLKNIEKIEVYRKRSYTEEPFLHFMVELSGSILEETQRGRGKTKNMIKSGLKHSAVHASYRMCVKEVQCSRGRQSMVKESSWLICNYMSTGLTGSKIPTLSDHLHLIPLVGVAVPLVAQGSEQGHLYCFLPLPLEGKSPTGLPIHINGSFVLDQTRHHIKWSTTDHDSTKNNEIKWNLSLVKEILPHAYVQLLLEIKSFVKNDSNTDISHSCLVNSLPCKTTAEPQWKTLVSECYKLYCGLELIYTEAGDGSWMKPDEAWYIDTNMQPDQKELLVRLLCYLGEPVVQLPRHVICGINENVITSLVSPSITRDAFRGAAMPSWMSRDNKLKALDYILSDQRYHELDQIGLLPLSTGEFTRFTTGYGGTTVYMASPEHPKSLLPGMDRLFLATVDDHGLLQSLQGLAASGHTQLASFDADAFVRNLSSVSHSHRSQPWFQRIWEYISRQFPHSLSRLQGHSILPVTLLCGSHEHLKLETGKSWLLLAGSVTQKFTNYFEFGSGCGKDVQNALKVLGVKLIQSINCPAALNHPQVVGKIVKEEGLGGVMSCLECLSSGGNHEMIARNFLKKTSDGEKRAFQGYCSRISSAVGISGHGRSLLQKLALFETPTSDGSLKFTSHEAVPVGCREKQVCHREEVADLSSDQARILAEALGTRVIGTCELIISYILPSVRQTRYSDAETFSIIKYIFNNHMTKHAGIYCHLETLKFVTTRTGRKAAPSTLFDPTDSMIEPFMRGDIVPRHDYMDFVDHLKALGLKTAATITATDVLTFAEGIGTNLEAARMLVKLVSHRSTLLTEYIYGKELGVLLKSFNWIPVKQQPPNEYLPGLPWYNSRLSLAKPGEVISDEYQDIAGALVAVTDCSNHNLACYYKWKRHPSCDLVMKQLAYVYELSKLRNLPRYVVGSVTQKIYSFIQGQLHNPSAFTSCQKIKDMIWNGTEFISAEKIVPNPPLSNMEPYVYKLPDELKNFKTLLAKCGMRETCDLIDILHKIWDHHSSGQGRGQVESERDRNLAILVLERLSKQGLATDILDDIPVPVWTNDNTLRMCEMKNCAYDERIWKQGFSPDNGDIQFVHPSMPVILVEALKVRTLASQVLDVTELDFEDFGQSEPLTRRLQNILEEYPDGFSVPKELIQNADDAGATEVSFVFDERQHWQFMSKLFDSNMAKCQGPALFVYNNAMFTENDFDNIIKLGGRTKESQMDKVGRFGLGFNSVYHLTDVPTFISGKYLVMLDPHVSHLNKCIRDKRNPGIRLNIGRKKAVEQFSDQYQPYEGIHGCAILQASADGYSYPGTLFRFPLRTAQQAEVSEISDKPYDQNEMKELLKLFIESIDTCILFTQNVRKITIYRLHREAKSFQEKMLLCCVEKQNKPDTKSDIKCLHDKYSQQNILKVALDIKKDQSGAEITSAVIAKLDCAVTAHARQYFQFDKESDQDKYWLICQMVNGHLMTRSPRNLKGSAPVGGIAVQLLYNGFKYLPKAIDNGRLFCFLPLPQRSELPVHINGCFALSSNRRHIVEPCSDDKYPAGSWNDLLLKGVISSAYVKALEILTDLCGLETFDIWPTGVNPSSSQRSVLAKCIFQRIASDNSLCIFTDGQRKTSMSGISFLKHGDFTFERNYEMRNCEEIARGVLCSALGQQGTIVVEIPQSIQKSFDEAGVQDVVNKRMYTRERFMEEVFLPNINTIQRSLRDKIMQLNILNARKTVDNLLKARQCIPVSPDGLVLKAPIEILYPEGEAAEMYTDEDRRFPFPGTNKERHEHLSYCTREMLRGLERIGMPRNKLTPSDICERASSVRCLPVDVGINRSRKIIQFLPTLLRSHNELALSVLKDVPFLPVMKQPETYPLPWHVSEDMYCTPAKAYTSENKYILGSVAPLVEEELFIRREEVRKFLGLCDRIPPHILIKAQVEQTLNQDPSKITDHKQFTEFQRCFGEVFRALERLLRHVECSETSAYASSELKGKPCILIGKTFVYPYACAIEFTGKCEPWLCEVPHGIRYDCPKLLELLGISERFNIGDFIRSLQVKHRSCPDSGLDKRDLTLAVAVIEQLIKRLVDERQDVIDIQQRYGIIYIPDAHGVLSPCADLCLPDDDFEAEEDSRFAHPDLSIKAGSILCKLGVKTSKQHTLSKRTLTFGSPFGQSEKLQNRIRRILTGYPFDSTILKELLQNADDAGATELHFILDSRKHSSDKVFGEGWKSLQGPALCVYNNKPFTKKDIEGIKNLGEGSKSEDATKTGQYGVGFNCVYHITDTPTFMTYVEGEGTVLVAFDPTCQYVPGVTVQEPGRMYTDITYLQKRFPDVFTPFMLNSYPVCNSTMFRLPLRTTSKDSTNWISAHVTVKEISELLKSFQDEAGECLLFLKNVGKVTISHVEERTSKVITDHWVTCNCTPEDMQLKKNFLKCTRESAKYLKEKGTNTSKTLVDVGHQEVTYSSYLKDANGVEETWAIVQTFGFQSGTDIPEEVACAHRCGDLGLLPLGGVAGLVKSNRKKRKNQRENIVHGKFKNEEMHKETKHIYCILPLPQNISLPVHLNGHFALDHESRRNLWSGKGASFRSSWNSLIMTQIVSPTYVSFMMSLHGKLLDISGTSSSMAIQSMDERRSYEHKIAKYNKFFPMDDKSPYVKEFVDAFYKRIYVEHFALFPVIWKPEASGQMAIEWFSVGESPKKQAVFKRFGAALNIPTKDDTSGNLSNSSQINVNLLEKALENCGYRFFLTPSHVYYKYKGLELHVDESSPEHVLHFFLKYDDANNPCHLKQIPQTLSQSPFQDTKQVVTLIRYCSIVGTFDQLLQGLPLLVTNDGILRTFESENPVFCTEFSYVFPQLASEFLHIDLIYEFLDKMKFANIKQLKQLDIPAVSKLLPKVLDSTVFADDRAYVEWTPAGNRPSSTPGISVEWLQKIWILLYHCFDRFRLEGRDTACQDISALFQQIMQPLSGWHLIPAKSGSSYFLLPLKWPHLIAELIGRHVTDEYLCTSLGKLGLPEVSAEVFLRAETLLPCLHLIRSLAANQTAPAKLLFAIHKWQGNFGACVKLSSLDAINILSYLSKYVSTVKELDYGSSTIRSLAIFTTCKKQLIALHDKTCFTVPNDIPEFNIDFLTQTNTVFLYREEPFRELYTALGVTHLGTVEVYCEYIFTHFSSMDANERYLHIRRISDEMRILEEVETTYTYIEMRKWTPKMHQEVHKAGSDKNILLSRLRELPFMSFEGVLCCASQFYDPTIHIFREMLPRKYFPPFPYWNEAHTDRRILEFLQKIGLVTTISKEHLLSFAKKIELMAFWKPPGNITISEWKDILHHKAKTLLHNLYQTQDRNVKLFEEMSKIAFVPLAEVDSNLSMIHNQYCRGTNSLNFIAISGGVQCSRYGKGQPELTWASSKLIDPCFFPSATWVIGETTKEKEHHEQWILDTMQIKEKPTVEMVVRNVKQVCLEYIKSQHSVNDNHHHTVKRVLIKSYEFLFDNEAHESLKELHNVPCICVEEGMRLVLPSQVSIEMKTLDQIQPYLYKIPDDLLRFKDLLLELGVTEAPTLQQYQDVLREIHGQSAGKVLIANELRNSYLASLGLFISLSRQKEKELGKNILYLPSKARMLEESNKLYYIDNPSFKGRVQECEQNLIFDLAAFQDVQQAHNTAEVQVMLGQGVNIYDVFPEDKKPMKLSGALNEKLKSEQVKDLDVQQCKIAKNLDDRFKALSFQRGICRIVKASEEDTNDLEHEIITAFSAIKVRSLSKVLTYLEYKDGHILKESDKEQNCFLEFTSGSITLYIAYNANDTVYSSLAKYFGEIFPVLACRNLELRDILSCDLDKIDEILNDHKVAVDETAQEHHGLPKLGTYIPIEEHHLLCQGFELFYKGEYVGYMIDDSGADNTQPVFIYAQIDDINTAGTENYLMTKCTINVGDNILKEESVVNLFKFQRVAPKSGPVVPYTGEGGSEEMVQEESLDETLKKITEELKYAWQLSEEEKRRAIRRLMLKWHPDKNVDNQAFCTKVMQHIQNVIGRLESGNLETDPSDWPDSPSGYKTYYDQFYDQMGARARQHRRYEEAYRDNLGRSTGSYNSSSSVPPSFAKKNPQGRVAQRWINQAEWDLRAAPRDHAQGALGTFPEWVCFKCHQAAEKALRGAQYAVDATMVSFDHNLIAAAISLDSDTLLSLAQEIEGLLGGSTTMRYPNRCGDSIPHDVFTDHMAEQAIELAEKIVDLCKAFILSRT